MRGWLCACLVWTGCPKPEESPDSSNFDPDSETGTVSIVDSDTPPTQTTPTEAAMTVRPPDVALYPGATFVVSDAAGAYFGEVAVSDPGMRLVGIPIGGSVTWAFVDSDGKMYLRTISGVQDGDDLWFAGPFAIPAAPSGTFSLSIPAAPGVPYDRWSAMVPCQGMEGYALPFSTTDDLSPGCGGATWSSAALAHLGPDPVPVAVAYDTDAPVLGLPPDQTVSLVLDPWITDFGRQTVQFDYSGPDATVELGAGGHRDRFPVGGEVWVDAVGTGAHLEVTVFADDAAHDELQVHLSRVTSTKDRWLATFVSESVRDLPHRGEAGVQVLTADDLPPVADGLAPPIASRTAGLTLPASWSCDGLAANAVEIGWSATDGPNVAYWTAIAPYAESATLPELSPALEEALAEQVAFDAYVAVKSVPDGFDVFRNSPLQAFDVEDPEWLSPRLSAGRICVAISGTPR